MGRIVAGWRGYALAFAAGVAIFLALFAILNP